MDIMGLVGCNIMQSIEPSEQHCWLACFQRRSQCQKSGFPLINHVGSRSLVLVEDGGETLGSEPIGFSRKLWSLCISIKEQPLVLRGILARNTFQKSFFDHGGGIRECRMENKMQVSMERHVSCTNALQLH
ncbi:uncharacterized protein CIMG_11101 [Coccidioides immitis RS]|uniref:Uncharacterized protein n=1 Tax=Coccidioides immitis (strain RS) TaxID=246410 RepID=A0A0D8JWG9_COCIM|nr:uncharacterized protein CIMG_11101 [Coccidioides immitis RS]KJF61489.1 hypothetical protein CIMG_11101 [Coccidioides immitis RS]